MFDGQERGIGLESAAKQGMGLMKPLSTSEKGFYHELVNEGIDPDDAYNFLHGYRGNDPKAGKLISISSFDGDKDGRPDFDLDTQYLIAATLGIKIDESKSLETQVKVEADKYIKDKRKNDELSPKKLQEAEEDYDFWMRVLGVE